MNTPAPVKLRDRLSALTAKRVQLKKRIADEMARPAPDSIRVRTLKRMQVRLKDQVALIMQQIRYGNMRSTGDAA